MGEVAERRVARSEVVEAELDPELPQAMEDLRGRREIGSQQALGHLQPEAVGGRLFSARAWLTVAITSSRLNWGSRR